MLQDKFEFCKQTPMNDCVEKLRHPININMQFTTKISVGIMQCILNPLSSIQTYFMLLKHACLSTLMTYNTFTSLLFLQIYFTRRPRKFDEGPSPQVKPINKCANVLWENDSASMHVYILKYVLTILKLKRHCVMEVKNSNSKISYYRTYPHC